MINSLIGAQKILIIGDSGRGKTTLAQKISDKLNLPLYSTDDFFWKIKFTEPNDKVASIVDIEKVYVKNNWVMEGSSTHLFQPGLNESDIIIQLKFKTIFSQWWSLIKRNRKRKNESIFDLLKFLIYVARKRYNIGYKKVIKNKELLKPFEHKTIILRSYKEINKFIENISPTN